MSCYSIGKGNFIVLNDINIAQTIFKHNDCIARPPMLTQLFADSKTIVPFGIVTPHSSNFYFERRKLLLNSVIAAANREYIETQIDLILRECLFPKLNSLLCISNDGINCKDKSVRSVWYARDDLLHSTFNVMFGAMFGSKNLILSDNDTNWTIFNGALKTFINTLLIALFKKLFPIIPDFIFKNNHSKCLHNIGLVNKCIKLKAFIHETLRMARHSNWSKIVCCIMMSIQLIANVSILNLIQCQLQI